MKDIFSFFESPPKLAEGDVACLLPDAARTLAAYLRAAAIELRFEARAVQAMLLSEDSIRLSSFGQVQTSATTDDANEPVPGGLLCPKIFGPVKDYECACGKYERMRDRGIVCEKCGVEVIQSKVRRERFAHLELAAPCRHPVFADEAEPLKLLPVLPPDLRPDLVGRYARVIEENERVREKMVPSPFPTASMTATAALQSALDELFLAPQASLKSVIDGIWQRSVFSKPVDYSGIAALVADPSLDVGWCRVPHSMLVELFRPAAYGILEDRGFSATFKGAKRLMEKKTSEAQGAVRQASEGRHLLLATDHAVVVRRARGWDEPAIAVDPETARKLGAYHVAVHVPLTHEAGLECSQLPDLGELEAEGERSSGWLSNAIGAESFLAEVKRAVLSGAVDHVDDPLLAAALGRAPADPDSSALERWREADRERERAAGEDLDAASAASGAAVASERQRWESLLIEELELSVQTFGALSKANIETVADLCTRTEAELLRLPAFGRQSLRESKELLADLNLSLGQRW